MGEEGEMTTTELSLAAFAWQALSEGRANVYEVCDWLKAERARHEQRRKEGQQ